MMSWHIDVAALISTYGIAILAPLAIIEGPIVTIIAAYLASLSLLSLRDVLICVVLADLVGDSMLYAVGRYGLASLPTRWRLRIGLSRRRLATLIRAFRTNGVRMLFVGKLTHAAGFAVLIAAGAARMPFGKFLLTNLVATVPKSLIFVAIGYLFGSAHDRISNWFSVGSIVLIGLAGLALLWRFRWVKAKTA